MAELFETSKIVRDASMSRCGRYRWTLTRCWDFHAPWCGWIMLNPSTADHREDDATIRRCMGFARAWGYGGITVLNLFALRATNPQELRTHPQPINCQGQIEAYDRLLVEHGTDSVLPLMIAAWGAHGSLYRRSDHVVWLFRQAGVRLHCLGTTKDGHPRHPLYLPADTPLVPFGGSRDG